MEKVTTIVNDKFGKFKLNISTWANSDVVPIIIGTHSMLRT